MVAHKVRVYLTTPQKQVLNSWFGCARWTYNRAVQQVRSKQVKANKGALRKACVNNAALGQVPWVAETPYDIRDEAMADVVKAIQSNFAAKRERFDLKFRSRRDECQSISVLKKHWNHARGVYSQVLNSRRLRSAEKLPDVLECDSRLIRTRLGHYYLCLPMELKVSGAENQGAAVTVQTACVDGIISLDPGIRTFMTGYDASGQAWEWGRRDIERIYRLCHISDKLQSRWTEKGITHKQRYSLQRAARRVRLKIRNLIDDVHKKLCKWLCENYRVVLIPTFETSRMVRRGHRKLNSKSARAMATWAHYRFRQRLLQKSSIYTGMSVVVCDEAYTSKTCGRCGELNTRLGGSKVFKCASCGAEFDRDVNGARNILLRYMTLHCHEACTSV
jgi:putative transposase